MKTKVTILLSTLFLAGIFVISSCTKDEVDSTVRSYTPEEYATLSASLDLPEGTYEYKNPELPRHFSSGGFLGSGITNHGATLGRVLFYETRLSKNNTVSCASCHRQTEAFAEPRALSLGFDGEETDRNSLALGNARFYYFDRGFFWDERAATVEEQVRQTVSNHIEMGMDMELIPSKLENDDYYKILFKKAFGDSQITSDKISNALSQFVRSIISSGSPFDKAMEAETNTFDIGREFQKFSAAENRGKTLYRENCESCHGNVLFLGQAHGNNGLDMEYADKGMGTFRNDVSYNGVFKIPFLRNIELTGPYMHDGRFDTLEEVIDHYSNSVKPHANLSRQLKDVNDQPINMNFSDQDKQDLIAFLKTLTDQEFITDDKYKNPF